MNRFSELQNVELRSSIDPADLIKPLQLVQQQYDANHASVQQAIDTVYNLDIMKGVDKEYANERLSAIVQSLNSMGNLQVQNNAIAAKERAAIQGAIDGNVKTALASTANARMLLKEIETIKKEHPELYAVPNEAFSTRGMRAWLEDKNVGVGFSGGSYVPYTDYKKKHQEIMAKFKQLDDYASVDVPDGHGGITTIKKKEMTPLQVQAYINANLDAQDLQQMTVDGWARYGQYKDEDKLKFVNEEYKQYEKYATGQIKSLEARLKASPADAETINSEIDSYKRMLTSKKNEVANISNFKGDALNQALAKHDYFTEAGFAYSYSYVNKELKTDQRYWDNAKHNLDVAQFQHTVQKDAQDALREERKLELDAAKEGLSYDASGKLVVNQEYLKAKRAGTAGAGGSTEDGIVTKQEIPPQDTDPITSYDEAINKDYSEAGQMAIGAYNQTQDPNATPSQKALGSYVKEQAKARGIKLDDPIGVANIMSSLPDNFAGVKLKVNGKQYSGIELRQEVGTKVTNARGRYEAKANVAESIVEPTMEKSMDNYKATFFSNNGMNEDIYIGHLNYRDKSGKRLLTMTKKEFYSKNNIKTFEDAKKNTAVWRTLKINAMGVEYEDSSDGIDDTDKMAMLRPVLVKHLKADFNNPTVQGVFKKLENNYYRGAKASDFSPSNIRIPIMDTTIPVGDLLYSTGLTGSSGATHSDKFKPSVKDFREKLHTAREAEVGNAVTFDKNTQAYKQLRAGAMGVQENAPWTEPEFVNVVLDPTTKRLIVTSSEKVGKNMETIRREVPLGNVPGFNTANLINSNAVAIPVREKRFAGKPLPDERHMKPHIEYLNKIGASQFIPLLSEKSIMSHPDLQRLFVGKDGKITTAGALTQSIIRNAKNTSVSYFRGVGGEQELKIRDRYGNVVDDSDLIDYNDPNTIESVVSQYPSLVVVRKAMDKLRDYAAGNQVQKEYALKELQELNNAISK